MEIRGRSDKKFCSLACKNTFASLNRLARRNEMAEIDAYLHRNREILSTLMGEASKMELDLMVLTRTGFRYESLTSQSRASSTRHPS